MEGGGLPPPPQYETAPREAPQNPQTPSYWPDSPRDEARSRKRRRSRSPPTRRTRPQRSHSPRRHRTSTAHSRRSRSPRRHHNPPGPRSRRSCFFGRCETRHCRPMSASPTPHKQHGASRIPRRPSASSTSSPRHRRSRSPGRRHARHRRPMSTCPSPHEQHRASRSPCRPYASSSPSPRHHRSRTSSSEPSPPKAAAHLAWWSAPAWRDLRRWVTWAGVAERREGVQMVHTFEESRTRTPANPNDAGAEAAMPQAAWEALLRDAVQGLRRPYTPEALRWWLRQAPPQPTTTGPGRERARAREGQAKGQDTPGRGPGAGPSVVACSSCVCALVPTVAPSPSVPRPLVLPFPGPLVVSCPRVASPPVPCPFGRLPVTLGPSRPHPELTPRDPRRRTLAKTRRQSTDLTPHGPHRLTPTDHRTPLRGRRTHPHVEKGLDPLREPPRTPPRSPPPSPHRQATTPATARATTQAPEDEEDTALTPRTRGKDPQTTRDQVTGPQGGQPCGHPPDSPTRAAHPDPRSTV